jgi:hypothetical protein
MSNGDVDIRLDTCGCCDTQADPEPISNPPGQPQLRYRIDTQPGFFSRMVARIPHQTVPPVDGPASPDAARPLAALTARALDDPSIALLDAFAVVADVLTFYQERIANEGYLRTATERRSVLELARAIGYELSPGVAATAFLVFDLEDGVGAPGTVTVPAGTQVVSVPGQDETAQTFETSIALDARAEWNALAPRREDVEVLQPNMSDLFLAGIDTRLAVGTPILVVADERISNETSSSWDVRLLTAVEPDPIAGRTRIAWDGALTVKAPAQVFAFRTRTHLFGHNAVQFKVLPLETRKNFDPNGIGDAEDWDTVPDPVGAKFRLEADSQEALNLRLDLDLASSNIGPGSWLALAQPGPKGSQSPSPVPDPTLPFPPANVEPPPFVGSLNPDFDAALANPDAALFRVMSSPAPSILTRSDFGLSTPVTRVGIDNVDGISATKITRREAEIYAETAALVLGTRPVVLPVDGLEMDPALPSDVAPDPTASAGRILTLARKVADLRPGQTVALVGKHPSVQVFDEAEKEKFIQRIADPRHTPSDIVDAVRNALALRLVADDGSGREEDIAGARLELLDPPDKITLVVSVPGLFPDIPVPNMRRWHLRSPSGLSGTVELPLSFMEYLAPLDSYPQVGEVNEILRVLEAKQRTVLHLVRTLSTIYDRATLSMSLNVVASTNGETVAGEVIGSGNAIVPHQSFLLQRIPLTFVPSPDTATGSVSTLSVRVNGVLWREVPALFGSDGQAQVYTLRLSNEGNTSVIFGDGRHGTRLPTGTGNVSGTYRIGIGPDGQVDAGALSVLLTRPVGVRSVTNPQAATGAAPPAKLDDARQNAPLTVRTLDRAVSVTDIEDFAQSFAGVGKAQALLLWSGSRRLVLLTIAGADGQPVPEDAPLRANLAQALRAQGDPSLIFEIDTFVDLKFSLKVEVRVDERVDRLEVLAAVRAKLLDTFSFTKREIGQSVSEGEVVGAVQSVPGVQAANVTELKTPTKDASNGRLDAQVAHFEDKVLVQAELLTIDPGKLTVTGLVT